MAPTRDRVRGMNAALSTGEAGVGEMRPAKPPLRPRQLLVALAVAGGGVTAAVLTYRAVVTRTPSFTGQVTPAHAYYLDFAGDGTLKALDVRPGDHVTAGQVLATEDSTVDASNLAAARAEVAADTAELAADENPQATTGQQDQAQLALQKAQAAVASAQSALTTAQQTEKSSFAAAQTTVTGKQNVLDDDNARFAQSCAAPPSPSPTAKPTDAVFCQGLQAQITKDGAAVTEAQAELASTQTAATAEQQRDSDQLIQSQGLLQTLQNQSATPASVPPAAIAQARSALADAQAKVVQYQQALAGATIVAPADGMIADTAGAIGDEVHPDGIRIYGGPAAQSGSNAGQQQGFQLFAPQPGTGGGGGTQPGNFLPVVTLYSGPMTVTAQLPEANIGDVHPGEAVSLAITAVPGTVSGTVTSVLLDPARVPDAVYYDVVISMAGPPPGVLPGMTVNVTLKG